MEINNVSLIGLGALGVLFARQLSDFLPAGSLSIIADEDRIARYRRDGFCINGNRCDFKYIVPEAPVEPADLLMIAVKYNGLDEAIDAIKNHVGPNTIILSLLNGITSETLIGREYGPDKVLLCVAQGMDAVKVGNALTYQNKGRLVFGDAEPDVVSEKTAAVDRFFNRAGIVHEVSREMKKHLWSKFMFNAGINQTTAVYLCDYEGVQKAGPYRETMVSAMQEVAGLAEKEGIVLTRADIDYWLGVLAGLSPGGKTSMQQDVEARRPSEVALFGGAVLALSEKHSIGVPANRLLYEKLQAIESLY